MSEETREWLEKAEADFETAAREAAVRNRPNTDAVCFHAQQCVEKWMKGVLCAKGVRIPFTHDLVMLNELVAKACPGWATDEAALYRLTRGAVQFRYPMARSTVGDARTAFSIAEELRSRLLVLLRAGDVQERKMDESG